MAMKFGRDMNTANRMNLDDFGNSLTFHIVPPDCESFHLMKYLQDELAQNLVKDIHIPR